MNKYHLLATLSAALCCLPAVAIEEKNDSPQGQSQRNAESDGAAIAAATYCATPKATMLLYAQALLNISKRFASNNNIEFSHEIYRENARHSFNETMGFMNLLSPTPENKKKNCDAVKNKISNAIKANTSLTSPDPT